MDAFVLLAAFSCWLSRLMENLIYVSIVCAVYDAPHCRALLCPVTSGEQIREAVSCPSDGEPLPDDAGAAGTVSAHGRLLRGSEDVPHLRPSGRPAQ